MDAELHGLIIEHCENELLASMIADLRRKARMFSLKRLENRTVPVCKEHMAMIDALARGDAQSASANIRQSIIDKLSSHLGSCPRVCWPGFCNQL